MRAEVIEATTIDAAVERILNELKEDPNTASRSLSSRNNVVYFDGWDGLGASAVLRAVEERLAPAAPGAQLDELRFDEVIHIDCSKWESRRALQRAIAEKLNLPARVMKMLDRQDEEDDYYGVAQDSRAEISEVVREMYEHIQKLNRRFLVIFHNGSGDEVDLASFCGFPLSGYSTNKVLWTFQGRFRLYPRDKVVGAMKRTGTKTDVFLSASHSLVGGEPLEFRSLLVRQEATGVVARSETTGNNLLANGPAAAQVVGESFFLHMLKLCCIGHNLMEDYDLATHACNYWICDNGTAIQQGDLGTPADDHLWQAADALQREMRLDVGNYQQYDPKYFPYRLERYGKIMMPFGTSPSYGFLQIPAGAIPNADMFQDFNKVSVLKLSRRTFSCSSPPFIYCHNLRFLWLDHCQLQEASSMDDDFPQQEEEKKKIISTDGEGTEEDFQHCLQGMLVLDIRYTRCDQFLSARMLDLMALLRELDVTGAQDWDMGQLQGRLPNIRKLRVTKSTVGCSSCSGNNFVLEMNKMELLEFSGNRTTMQGGVANLSEISTSNNRLETVVIIDGCAGIRKISFRGCAELKNLLLSGLFEDLCILDLSGTAVKTLDLSAMTARGLDELLLNDCEKLCAILWPPKDKRKRFMEKLRIGTTQSAASLLVAHGGRVHSEFNWCISVRDARLLRSLVPFKEYFGERLVHVEVFSPAIAFGSGKDGGAVDSRSSNKKQQQLVNLEQRPKDSSAYVDIADSFEDHKMPLLVLQESESDGDAPTLTRIWPCPRIPSPDLLTCYMHIQDHQPRRTDESPQEGGETSISIPDIICDNASVLHVHDSFSITSIQGSRWYYLSWCRVERCPKLKCVFTTTPRQLQESSDIFYRLKTLWVSQLPEARFVWDWSQFGNGSFEDLTLLHLDLCPRVIHILPLAVQRVYSLRNLVTLEIVWCGDLKDVFPLYTDAKSDQHQQQKSNTVKFWSLRCIHLHEVPKLQGICGGWRMSAPKLETIKIRGCWSLKRLPAVSKSKKVECDCEKEWWDKLEWDGLDVDHHPSLYKPTHSRYYKKTMLRGSVLI